MAKQIKTVSDLIPDHANANKGTERGRYAVEASLRETGAGRSIVVDKNGKIIAGNKTLESWADISGEIEIVRTDGKKLVVVQREDLDLDDVKGLARKLAYYDNRAGQLGLEWDAEQLFSDLNAGVDLSGMFFDDEIADILATIEGYEAPTAGEDPGADVSKADELQAVWNVQLGDLWQLGDHRLICGDCTDAKTVARVMGGEKADLLLTDPPYGVSYADKNAWLNAVAKGNSIQTPIENDHGDIEQTARNIWLPAFSLAFECCCDTASFYVFMPQGGDQMMMMMMMMSEAGWMPRHELIWLKNNHVLGRADYNYKHEPILYGWKRKGTHKFYGDFQTSVIECSKPQKSDLHPTTKPVELIQRLVPNNTQIGETVYEPFSGSGTTIIACEQLSRRCRAVELHPPYVAVALQRWADMTGKTPIKLT
jgi:DNA modification methylase